MQENQKQQLEQSKRLNANRVYIYTENCTFCGQTDDFADLSIRLKNLGKNVFTRQTTLWTGWKAEADELELELPCIFDCDTQQCMTVEEGNNKTDEELKEWLNALD